MATLTTEQKMLKYFSQLSGAEQKSVLNLIETFVANKEDAVPVTIEGYNKELDEANARINAGEFVTHEEIMKSYLR